MMDDRPERQPLPSEDTGDLIDEPAAGQTDDYLVASEEGVPYVPPTDRVISEARESESGADVAGTAESDAGELERDDAVQPADGALPRDDELQADVIEALRSSDVPAGDRIRIAVVGSVAHVRGEVDSVDVLDEILGIVGDVVGVDEVVDELTVTGL
ncbi:MAG: BON domain-containing protein [Candidatus Limnocylindria bacterium]